VQGLGCCFKRLPNEMMTEVLSTPFSYGRPLNLTVDVPKAVAAILEQGKAFLF
jgi:hypothetical protein